MEQLFFRSADFASNLFSAGWLPLTIWTLAALLIWMVLRWNDSIHPVYQYHSRLAIIIALPAGFLLLLALEAAQGLFIPAASEATLKVFYVTSPIEIGLSQPAEESAIPFTTWLSGFAFLLIAGGALLTLIRFVAQCVQLMRLRASCKLMPVSDLPGLSDENRSLLGELGKLVKIAFIEKDVVPVTFGFRKPVVILPSKLQSEPEKMNLALCHELTHIRQNDFFSHMVVTITQAIFWYHPLVHKLRTELIEYRELRCDSAVLAKSSVSRKKYASLLLELIPMPNIDKELSVNMAQESSNLKKRITMISQKKHLKTIPGRSSLSLLAAIFFSTAIVMACTDMQTHTVFDDEDLNLMTDIDRSGDRGYHQIVIFLSEEDQAERHENKMSQLQYLQPDHIKSIEILKNEAATSRFGERGEKGVIIVNTNLDPESYNTVLETMGLERQDIQVDISNDEPAEDYFVVVEDMPELIGGLQTLQQKIRYPEMARRAGIEGRVYVQFIVNEEGQVENPQIIRGIGGGADEEALRVVSEAEFRPGMQRGRPVRVQYSIPILFRLASGEQTSAPTSTPAEPAMLTITGYGGN
ncbi:MAG: TonB family protein [Balneolaceae bacterium]|nr:TonB family protein [Balneolaceae bacterium]MCH8548753.1 M56 family metallopeptidase [Balneolaceae bacterium]